MRQRPRRRQVMAVFGVILVSVASAALFMLLRTDGIGIFTPLFSGACERLRDSGLLEKTDWWCFHQAWRAHTNFMIGALTVGIGLAFPTAVLAATGRRWTAMLPLVAAPFGLSVLGPQVLYWTVARNDGLSSWGPVGLDQIAAGVVGVVVAVLIAVAVHRRSIHIPVKRLERLASITLLAVVAVALASFVAWNPQEAVPLTLVGALAVNLLLVVAPAIAISGIVGRRDVHLLEARTIHRVAAGALCIFSIVALLLILGAMHPAWANLFNMLHPAWANLFNMFGFESGSAVSAFFPSAIVVGVFAALLGADRRYWPWTIAVTAFFLSQGPSLLVFFKTSPDGIQSSWTLFGAVLPLFLVGMIGSAWQPLSARLSRRSLAVSAPSRPDLPTELSPDRPRVRPIVLANTLAACLLLTSRFLYLGDPIGIQVATPLPTYLGARIAANEARADLDLSSALAAGGAYFAKRGTYEGFDARAAEAIEPFLAWQDGTLALDEDASPGQVMGPNRVAIVEASSERLQLAIVQEGIAVCGERSQGRLTYGEAKPTHVESGGIIRSSPADLLPIAIANCADSPWNASLARPAPILDCLPDTNEFLICRMVELLIHDTMTTPAPE